jgi:acyl dehydratase
MSEAGLYFEDLRVGQKFAAGPLTLSLDDMRRFSLENDPQTFHIDPDGAKQGPFGGLIGSGWQTAAVSIRMVTCDSKLFALDVIGAGADVEWRAPTRPGDSLSVEWEVLELAALRSRADRGLVRVRVTTRNQTGAIVMTMGVKMIVFRRPALSGS